MESHLYPYMFYKIDGVLSTFVLVYTFSVYTWESQAMTRVAPKEIPRWPFPARALPSALQLDKNLGFVKRDENDGASVDIHCFNAIV